MSENLTKLREAIRREWDMATKHGRCICATCDEAAEDAHAALAAVEQEMNALLAAAKRWGWIRAMAHLTTDDDGCLVLVAGIALSLQEAAWLKDDEQHALGGVIPLPADHDPMLQPGCVYRGDALDRAVDANIAAEIADALPPHPDPVDVRDEEASGDRREWDGLDFGGSSGKW